MNHYSEWVTQSVGAIVIFATVIAQYVTTKNRVDTLVEKQAEDAEEIKILKKAISDIKEHQSASSIKIQYMSKNIDEQREDIKILVKQINKLMFVLKVEYENKKD